MTDIRGSYLRNYLKVYLWQALSIATGFLSMFVVLPHLSSRPAIFGIYSVCISLTALMAYADLGFVNSGFRHASACFVKGDLRSEVRTVGFVSFVLVVFAAIQIVVVSICAMDPSRLIEGLSDPQQRLTASVLLTILAVFSPVIVLQRILQIVFGIRIEDFVYQRINIASNLLKIASVFIFFDESGYDIVGYFLTSQLLGLGACLASLELARRRYRYDLRLLVRSCRFSREIFQTTRRLAFSSVFMTLTWILYFELDALFIGKVLGAESLAAYSVALSLAVFARSMSSALFAPFRARINHFVELGDDHRLRSLYLRVLVATLPAVVFPIVSVIVLMEPFVFSWVGPEYALSVVVAQLLLLSYVDAFSSYPASFLLMAQERVKEINVMAAISPVLFWCGVAVMIGSLGIGTFAGMKLAAGLPALVYGLLIGARCLGMSGAAFVGRVLVPALPPVAVLIVLLAWAAGALPHEKSHLNVAIVVATGGAASVLATLVYYLSAPLFRKEVAAVSGWSLWRPPAQARGV